MRMLLHVKLPVEPFNAFVRDGTAGRKIQQIVDEAKPEAVYLTNYDGQRGAVMIVDVEDPSRVPALAEPWFLTFDADVQFHIVMKPDDLTRAGLESLGKKWA
ncbi:MAG: panthothenate synthetase [Armatimonadota bacterium]